MIKRSVISHTSAHRTVVTVAHCLSPEAKRQQAAGQTRSVSGLTSGLASGLNHLPASCAVVLGPGWPGRFSSYSITVAGAVPD